MIAGRGLMIFRLRLAVTTAIQELQVPSSCQSHDPGYFLQAVTTTMAHAHTLQVATTTMAHAHTMACVHLLRDCYTTARCDSSLTTAALTIPTSLVHCYHIASPLLSHHKSTAALTSPHRCYHITSPLLSHHKSTAVTSQSPLLR